MSGWPVRFGGQTPPVEPAPLLGQHSEEVLADWLRMDRDQIGALRNDAVIALMTAPVSAPSRTRAGCASSRSTGPRC